MLLEILAHVPGRCRICRIPDQGLTNGSLCVDVLRMSLEDANALSAGLSVVCQQDAQLNGKARVGGIALSHATHGGNGLLLAVGRAIQSLIISQSNIPF